MNTLRRVAAAAASVATVCALAAPAVATARAEDPAPDALASDRAAVDLLRRTAELVPTIAYDARLLVVAFDTAGPSVVELDVVQAEGDLRVSRGEAWTLGRSDSQAFVDRAGELLQLGSVAPGGLDAQELTEKYAVVRARAADLDTGRSRVLEIVERSTGWLRERLFIDERTGLVVRRETFGEDGAPLRLAAFTQLRVRPQPVLSSAEPDTTEAQRTLTQLSDESLDILSDVGWRVPEELPGGFALQAGYALPESEGGSVHLVYSDGLYTLSLYEQVGRLDHDGLDGAVAADVGTVDAYRWPGSEPERMVWSGDGLTFTLISDAPDDTLRVVAEALPHAEDRGLVARMVRGLTRVADWAWPFN